MKLICTQEALYSDGSKVMFYTKGKDYNCETTSEDGFHIEDDNGQEQRFFRLYPMFDIIDDLLEGKFVSIDGQLKDKYVTGAGNTEFPDDVFYPGITEGKLYKVLYEGKDEYEVIDDFGQKGGYSKNYFTD